jgi:molecular chaperone HscA
VTFQVDADGLLNVEAVEETTGAKSNIDVKPSYGLSDNEIEGMIRDSMDNAQADMEARRLREQKVEADRTLEALDSAMKSDADTMLNDGEIKTLLEAREQLQNIKDSSEDSAEVKAAIKNMEKVAEFYVARRMDDNVKTAMQGQSVSDFSDNISKP